MSIACWAVVVVVILRIASGGSLTGVRYVLQVEPAVVVAFGLATLVIAAIVIVAMVLDAAWSWRASRSGAVIAVATSVMLLLGDHASAALAAAASATALFVGRMADPRPPRVDG